MVSDGDHLRIRVDRIVFDQLLSDPRAISQALQGHSIILIVDNSSVHGQNADIQETLQSINNELRRLSARTTHLFQPLDNFIVKAINGFWGSLWDADKKRKIEQRDFCVQSGRVNSTHRHWSMVLDREITQHLNGLKD